MTSGRRPVLEAGICQFEAGRPDQTVCNVNLVDGHLGMVKVARSNRVTLTNKNISLVSTVESARRYERRDTCSIHVRGSKQLDGGKSIGADTTL